VQNIFANEAFRRPDAVDGIIGKKIFGLNFYNDNEIIIRNMRYSDCFRNGVFKSVREWQEEGLNINLNTWLRLRNAMLFSKRKLSTNTGTLETVADFSARLKRGSRKILKFFDNFHEKSFVVENLPSFKTFVTLTNCTPDGINIGDWISLWHFNPLPNDLKQFIFHCRFNSLPLNNRLHAYKPEVDPRRSFCRLDDVNTKENDNFAHCFFDCVRIRSLLSQFFLSIKTTFENTDKCRKFFWYGIMDKDDMTSSTTTTYNIIFDIFRYILFKYRTKHILPGYDDLLNQIKYMVSNICRVNKKFENNISTCW
jgi:hypothetical protein